MHEDTAAIRAATEAGLSFEVVRTRPPASAEESAALQRIELGRLLRTIVVRRGPEDYVFVLVLGGRQMSWPLLRAHLGVKRLSLPDAEEAKATTGYERGAITPFGSAQNWPVIADAAIGTKGLVAIGGGARGLNLHLDAADLTRALDAQVAEIAEGDGHSP